MGSYNCRTIARSKIYSEHSYGTAIDIADIDGANVKLDWSKDTKKGEILNNAYNVACKYFNNILTPSIEAFNELISSKSISPSFLKIY